MHVAHVGRQLARRILGHSLYGVLRRFGILSKEPRSSAARLLVFKLMIRVYNRALEEIDEETRKRRRMIRGSLATLDNALFQSSAFTYEQLGSI